MGQGGIQRGQLRPHFAGRNPPFLIAALCVGILILGVSYWSVCSQFSSLEEELKKLIQVKESFKKNDDFLKKQLQVREEDFNRVRLDLKKKEAMIEKLRQEIKGMEDQQTVSEKRTDDQTKLLETCKESLQTRDDQIADIKLKFKALEDEKQSLQKNFDAQRNTLEELERQVQNLLKQKHDQQSPGQEAPHLAPAASSRHTPENAMASPLQNQEPKPELGSQLQSPTFKNSPGKQNNQPEEHQNVGPAPEVQGYKNSVNNIEEVNHTNLEAKEPESDGAEPVLQPREDQDGGDQKAVGDRPGNVEKQDGSQSQNAAEGTGAQSMHEGLLNAEAPAPEAGGGEEMEEPKRTGRDDMAEKNDEAGNPIGDS